MSLEVRRWCPEDSRQWDELVAESWNGTFLHTRRFLSYHGDRFEDVSLIIEDEKQSVMGVFPAAIDPANTGSRVVSHPGITYGGIVHNGSLQGAKMLESLQAIADVYRQDGAQSLRYKVVPSIYHRVPASDDLYALFRLGAIRYRSDLSSAIDLHNRPTKRRRIVRRLREAERVGITFDRGARYLAPYWDILEENLRNHAARPVHSLEEISQLHSMFPENIECVVGVIQGMVVAGTVLFHTHQATHTQYIAATHKGHELSALDGLVEHCISQSGIRGTRYFSFGISTERDGDFLNEGLYRFKAKFGAGGIVHEFYELPLA